MTIGQAAASSGLPAKTIRFYEEIGLVEPARRTDSGYRVYSDADIHVLRFVERARRHGFTVEECRQLLALYRDDDRSSGEVKALTEKRIADIDAKIDELKAMRRTLSDLADRCHGDGRPDCPILDDLADGGDHE
ncbi:MAG: Cu(I)-responsive transcriptional regulator [Pseudomonadota bacterium]